jgi:hypothetical protein
MKRKFKLLWKVSAWAVPTLTFAYGAGSFLGWWDHLLGRTALAAAYERLKSPGYPKAFVFVGEPEFQALLEWAIVNGTDPGFRENTRNQVIPTGFTRAGGAELVAPMPEDQKAVFVPDSSPILALYNYTPSDFKQGTAQPVGSLGDIPRALARSQSREQFYVTTVLLGVLSLLLVWKDTRD